MWRAETAEGCPSNRGRTIRRLFDLAQPQRLVGAGFALIIPFVLAGCAAQYAEVSPKKPRLMGLPGTGVLAAVEQAITKAVQEEHAYPLKALGDCLAALETTSRELRRHPAS